MDWFTNSYVDPVEQQRLEMAKQLGIGAYGAKISSPTDDPSFIGSPDTGFGWNLPTAALGVGAVGTLGNLYGGLKANKLAKQQFDFTKQAYQTNLANSIKSYNTALEDRVGSRMRAAGKSQEEIDAYLNKNRLG